MTYLDIINNVLRRLREDTVSSPGQNAYSRMVGAFINDAKMQVEDSWDWTANRQLIQVQTIDGQQAYSLTGIGEKCEVLGAWNATNKLRLRRWSAGRMLDTNITSQSPGTTTPTHYAMGGIDGNGDIQVGLWQVPDQAYDLEFWVSAPSPELVNTADNLLIPWRPVVLLSTAMLAEEKGEAGGYTSARYFEMADKSLSDAIAYDAGLNPTETDWVEV